MSLRTKKLTLFRMLKACLCNVAGQATVEAAFALPVLMTLFLLLLQPGIIFYDYIIMQSAAAEGCRLLATASSSDTQVCTNFIRRRLSAVPELDLFHSHQQGCAWEIELVGNESSQTVEVTIKNKLKPLPLIGAAAGLLGLTNAQGNLEIQAKNSLATQPEWAQGQLGTSPRGWIGAWT